MSLSLNFEGAADKAQLVAGLATLLASDCGEISASAIDAAATASGNSLPSGYAAVYAGFASKLEKGQLTPALGGGGGGGGGAAAAAGGEAAAPVVEAPKEEEVDALEGGMDMFGGGGGGGDY
jgi:hypothetical protein